MRIRVMAAAALVSLGLAGSPAGAATQTPFIHPGGLLTKADFDRMRAKVAAREHPWIDGWEALIADPKAQSTYRAGPKQNMGVSRQHAQDDARAAFLNAVRWRITGDRAFADCAMRNLNGWSATVNQVPHGVDQPGLSGIPVGTFALAAEVLRDYPEWSASDQTRFKTMLETYLYPVVDDFLTRHNGTPPSHYWANWDAANVLSLLAIGVYCDDHAKFDRGVEYYKNGIGNGNIMHAVPFLYPGNLGQWQESGRDHAHAFGGMGLMAEACQVAWNQNVDLYGYANNRLLAGANYEARYNQWIGVPYTLYNNADRVNQYYIATNYHGRLGNCEYYELLYNHYGVLKKLDVPDVKRFAELLRPEGGNVDLMGYGTLFWTLDAKASPYPTAPVAPAPLDVTAEASSGHVFLRWSPSGAYTTRGYTVLRADRAEGPFASVFSIETNTSPEFTDTKVENGRTYFYRVVARNRAGMSEPSAIVRATPLAAGEMPAGWKSQDIGAGEGTAGYVDAVGGTFALSSHGGAIGGPADACRFAYRTVSGDFTITARYADRDGPVQKAGLMIRQSLAPNAPMATLTLGEAGGRQARFGTRATVGGRWGTQSGDDYTWMPVWLRLQRVGNTVTASQSSDGVTWFTIGKSEIAFSGNYLIGLAINSGKPADKPAQGLFDHVTVGIAPPRAPAAPSNLTATAGPGTITLAWTNASPGSQDEVRIERSEDGTLFYEIASLPADARRFVNTGVSDRFFYRVRAGNGGGFSPYSNAADATPSRR
ncbi:MAG: alginate lyase family protein [Tepidisphaeraceae bacterium]